MRIRLARVLTDIVTEFVIVPTVTVFYDSCERKSGFCGQAPATRNARGPLANSLPVFIRELRAPGKKRNIRATQSVSPVPYVVLRSLPLWLLISPFPPIFAFFSFLLVSQDTLPLDSRSLSFFLARTFVRCRVASLRAEFTLRIDEEEDWRRIRLRIRRCRSRDLSYTSVSSPFN